MEKEFKVLVSGRIGTVAEFREPYIEIFKTVEDALDCIADYSCNGSVWKAELYDPYPETWEEFLDAPLTAWEEALKFEGDTVLFLHGEVGRRVYRKNQPL